MVCVFTTRLDLGQHLLYCPPRMANDREYPHGMVLKKRGFWIAYYYAAPYQRHQEACDTKSQARALLAIRFKQIGAGTFSPSLVTERRNGLISKQWTPGRRTVQSARMEAKNTEPEFRKKALAGILAANTPDAVAKRAATLKKTLSDPKALKNQIRNLRKSTRSAKANASRSAIIKGLHAQTELGCEQVLSLLREARRASERDWLMLLVTFWHRLKPAEAVALTGENFSADSFKLNGVEQQALIRHGEPLLDERAGVGTWIASRARGPKEQFFGYVSRKNLHRLMHRYARAAGLPDNSSHIFVLRNSGGAREQLWGRLKASPAANTPTQVPKPRKPRSPKPAGDRSEMRIFLLVEEHVPHGERRRSQITEARWAVAKTEGLAFDTVREYHRRVLKAKKSNE